MGEFANGYVNRVVAILLSVVVIGINIFFVMSRVQEAELSPGWISLVVIFAIAYIAFNFYLVIHMSCSIGGTWFTQFSFVRKYVLKNSGSLMDSAESSNSYSRPLLSPES